MNSSQDTGSGHAAKRSPVIVSPVFLNGTALVRAFGRRGSYCVAVSPEPRVAGFASRYAREKVILPNPAEAPGKMTSWLMMRKDLHGGLVIPTGDEVVAELDAHRDELSAHFRLAIPSHHACEVALDKWQLAQVCMDAGIPAPRTVKACADTAARDAASIGFPLIVKPCYGANFQRAYSSKAIIAEDAAQLQGLLAECREKSFDVILQELLPEEGPITSYSAYVTRSGRIAGDYSSRRIALLPPRFGVGFFEAAEKIDAVMSSGRRLIEALGYAGALINLDFKYDARDGRHKLLDLNARSWRQITLARAVGVDVLDMLARDYEGEDLPEAPDVHYGKYWFYLKDALLLRKGYRESSPPLATYLRCVTSQMAFGLFDARDPWPVICDIAPLVARRFWHTSRDAKR